MRDTNYHALMKKAAKRAKAQPVTPERCRDGRFETYRQFMSLTAHLQILVGDEPIYLPNDEVSKLLRCRWRDVRAQRGIAVREGYLTLIEKLRGSRSARYRVNLDRFPELQVMDQ